MDLTFWLAGDAVNEQVSKSQHRSLLLRVKAREKSRQGEITLLNVTWLDLIKDLTLADVGDGELVLEFSRAPAASASRGN